MMTQLIHLILTIATLFFMIGETSLATPFSQTQTVQVKIDTSNPTLGPLAVIEMPYIVTYCNKLPMVDRGMSVVDYYPQSDQIQRTAGQSDTNHEPHTQKATSVDRIAGKIAIFINRLVHSQDYLACDHFNI